MTPNYKNIISFVWAERYDKALAFYTNVLGFKKVFESDGWAELAVPGTKNAYLAVNRWNRDGRPPSNDFVTLGVEGMNDYKELLLAKDVRIKDDIELAEQGLRMLKFLDPEGNTITLAEVQL